MQSKGERTQRAILEAAVTRFGQDGYRATSVADIARQAGVGGSLVYAYFPNKEALFFAAADEDAAAVAAAVLGQLDATPVGKWRSELLRTMHQALDGHPLATRLLAGLEPDSTARVLDATALSELRRTVSARLEAGQADGTVRTDIDTTTVADGFVTVLLSLLMAMVQFGPELLDVRAPGISSLLAAALDVAP